MLYDQSETNQKYQKKNMLISNPRENISKNMHQNSNKSPQLKFAYIQKYGRPEQNTNGKQNYDKNIPHITKNQKQQHGMSLQNRRNSRDFSQTYQKENYNKNQKLQSQKFEEIRLLKEQLLNERKKYKELQQRTINDQMNVLNSLSYLEEKFNKISKQKKQLAQQLTMIKNQLSSQRIQTNFSNKKTKFYQFQMCRKQQNKIHSKTETQMQIERKYEQLQHQYKKIKGISRSLIDMMKKVESIKVYQKNKPKIQNAYIKTNHKIKQIQRQQKSEEADEISNFNDQLKQAWRWIKKVVQQYQKIKSKAMKWKKVYDQVVNNQSSEQQKKQQREQKYFQTKENRQKKIHKKGPFIQRYQEDSD